MKTNSNTTLIIIVTLIVAAAAYWYFFTGAGNQPPLSSSTKSDNFSQTQFQTLVNELSISFNTAIFSDAHFGALVDLTTQISPESAGRLDPFAPIEGNE